MRLALGPAAHRITLAVVKPRDTEMMAAVSFCEPSDIGRESMRCTVELDEAIDEENSVGLVNYLAQAYCRIMALPKACT